MLAIGGAAVTDDAGINGASKVRKAPLSRALAESREERGRQKAGGLRIRQKCGYYILFASKRKKRHCIKVVQGFYMRSLHGSVINHT